MHSGVTGNNVRRHREILAKRAQRKRVNKRQHERRKAQRVIDRQRQQQQ